MPKPMVCLVHEVSDADEYVEYEGQEDEDEGEVDEEDEMHGAKPRDKTEPISLHILNTRGDTSKNRTLIIIQSSVQEP
jgi:hypothetical protein